VLLVKFRGFDGMGSLECLTILCLIFSLLVLVCLFSISDLLSSSWLFGRLDFLLFKNLLSLGWLLSLLYVGLCFSRGGGLDCNGLSLFLCFSLFPPLLLLQFSLFPFLLLFSAVGCCFLPLDILFLQVPLVGDLSHLLPLELEGFLSPVSLLLLSGLGVLPVVGSNALVLVINLVSLEVSLDLLFVKFEVQANHVHFPRL
jgi:hypothetical protein